MKTHSASAWDLEVVPQQLKGNRINISEEPTLRPRNEGTLETSFLASEKNGHMSLCGNVSCNN